MSTITKELPSLQPYPDYEESGVEWIGKIPAGWKVKRLKHQAQLMKTRTESRPEGLRYLGLEHLESGNGGLTDAPEPAQVESMVALFKAGDVLFGKLRPYLAKVYLAEFTGCSSTEIIAFRAGPEMNSSFLKYWLLSPGYIEAANVLTFGSKMPRVSPEQLGNLATTVPPSDEQANIVAFLDQETTRIDKVVLEQKLLLEDLALKRQATISVATRCNPDAVLPADWRKISLKTALTTFEQGWSPQCDNRPAEDGEWGVMKVGCVNGQRFRPEENKSLPPELEPIQRYSLKLDDVLISRANTRDLVGSAARVDRDYPNLLLCDKLYRLRADQNQLRPAYLVYLLSTPVAREAIELAASGASPSMVNIAQSVIKNLSFPMPPVEEQDVILTRLDRQVAEIDNLMQEVRANIEDMRLHRSALITAAVTGKIDVRNLG